MRILGGREAIENSHPWIARIVRGCADGWLFCFFYWQLFFCWWLFVFFADGWFFCLFFCWRLVFLLFFCWWLVFVVFFAGGWWLNFFFSISSKPCCSVGWSVTLTQFSNVSFSNFPILWIQVLIKNSGGIYRRCYFCLSQLQKIQKRKHSEGTRIVFLSIFFTQDCVFYPLFTQDCVFIHFLPRIVRWSAHQSTPCAHCLPLHLQLS